MGFRAKYFNINGTWALKPHYLGPWTLRLASGWLQKGQSTGAALTPCVIFSKHLGETRALWEIIYKDYIGVIRGLYRGSNFWILPGVWVVITATPWSPAVLATFRARFESAGSAALRGSGGHGE